MSYRLQATKSQLRSKLGYAAVAVLVIAVSTINSDWAYILTNNRHAAFWADALCKIFIFSLLLTSLFKRAQKQKESEIDVFIVDETGSFMQLSNENQQYQILADSLVSSLFCWLYLSNKITGEKLWKILYRDSFEDKGYRRLCRIVAQQRLS